MTIREYYIEHPEEHTAFGKKAKDYRLMCEGKRLTDGTIEQLIPDYGNKEIIDIKDNRIEIKWSLD